MITRDVNQLMVVPALAHNARFHSCTVTGFTCYPTMAGVSTGIGTSEFIPGFTIDRLGLPRNFKSFMVAPVVYGDFATTGTSAGNVLVGTFWAGLQDTCTSGGTFASYSTQNWLVGKGLWRQTTATSTANEAFAPVLADVGLTSAIGIGGLTSTTTSTTASGSTGNMVAGTSSTSLFYYAGPGPAFDLSGAKRYIRVVMRTQFETTGCGSGSYHMSAAGIFGEPDEAQPPLPTRRILVTSGCAT